MRMAGTRSVRVCGLVLAIGGLVMVPWMIVLSSALPSTTQVEHWSAVWLGLDAVMAASLSLTGFLLWKGDERFRLVAMSTATLFVVDAWFDTMTAVAGRQRFFSCVLALFFELPVATLCFWLAFRAARPARPGAPRLSEPGKVSVE